MVHTTTPYRGDQKHDHTLLRGNPVLHSQSATGRRKGTQVPNRHQASFHAPIVSSGSCSHQIRLYVDKHGKIKTDGASSIADDDRHEILREAVGKYEKILKKMRAIPAHSSCAMKADAARRRSHTSLQYQPTGNSPGSTAGYIGSGAQALRQSNKRRRSGSEDGPSCVPDGNSISDSERPSSIGMVENQPQLLIEIQDSTKLKEYLFDAFTSFQQINCRTLCKSWIRMIEPKKQVNHPYNGNLKVKGIQKAPASEPSTHKDVDPEETKPRWWPSRDECPHKEPDHIKKEQRLALLCHILMNTGRLHDCKTNDLKMAILSDHAKIKPPEKAAILEDVWKIGDTLERFNRGEIDGNSQVCVNARKEEARMIRGGGRSRKPLDTKEESEEEESSECAEAGPESDKPLTPTTPSALAAAAQYLREGRTSGGSHVCLEEGRYTDNLSANHFPPSTSSKANYHDHQAEYPVPMEVNTILRDNLHHGPSSHAFDGHAFAVHAYGSMQDTRGHADLFPPDEQPILGQWTLSATPDLYPMPYTGEPSQPPALNPPDGAPIFDHYSYVTPPKQPYRDGGSAYPTSGDNHLAAGYEDDLARFQRINACSFPSFPAARVHPASMMRQHSYELPSHIRA